MKRQLFNPPLRPRTADRAARIAEGEMRFVERPRTADRAAKKIGGFSFPSQLRLRPLTEAPGLDTPWANPGEALVLSLDLQCRLRETAAAAADAVLEVTDSAHLTVWAMAPQPQEGSCVLEPLVARRVDHSLEVEPVEVVVELQTSGASSTPKNLHFGEGFRLRLAGGGLYLSHSGGHMHWERKPAEGWPRDSRFTAHGGELGAPVRFGRHLTLQRINSPPPSDSESESESSSESDSERILRGAPLHRRRDAKAAQSPAKSSDDAAAAQFADCLLSRLADKAPVLPSTFLPLA